MAKFSKGDVVKSVVGGPVMSVTMAEYKAPGGGMLTQCVYWNEREYKFEFVSIPEEGLVLRTAAKDF